MSVTNSTHFRMGVVQHILLASSLARTTSTSQTVLVRFPSFLSPRMSTSITTTVLYVTFVCVNNDSCDLLLALMCPELPGFIHCHPDSVLRYPGEVVTYYCDVGYKFADGTSTRTTICRKNATWSSHMEDCQSEFNAYVHCMLCFPPQLH